jgi:hypothetical protein
MAVKPVETDAKQPIRYHYEIGYNQGEGFGLFSSSTFVLVKCKPTKAEALRYMANSRHRAIGARRGDSDCAATGYYVSELFYRKRKVPPAKSSRR